MGGTVKAQGTLPYSVHRMRKSRQQHIKSLRIESSLSFPFLVYLCLYLYHSVILPFLTYFVLLSKSQATLPYFILLPLPQHPCGSAIASALHLRLRFREDFFYLGFMFWLAMCDIYPAFCSCRIWDSVSFFPPSHIPISLPISYSKILCIGLPMRSRGF